jgi:hypothetical protein
VFSQVDFGETSFPEEADKSIVTKLLSHAIGHHYPSLLTRYVSHRSSIAQI